MPKTQSPIVQVLHKCRGALVVTAVASGAVNILMLTGSLFMMQVYDRVLGSHSVPTLVGLSVLALGAYAFQGWLDGMRMRMLALVGERIDEEIAPRAHAAMLEVPLGSHGRPGETLQPLRDLESIRGFLSGPGPIALFDMPWMPIYLIVLYLLHPALGLLATGGACIIIAITFLTEMRTRGPARNAKEAASARNALVDSTLRNAEIVRAMGLMPALGARWSSINAVANVAYRRATFTAGALSAAAKSLRFIQQSALLGLGAYLAIRGDISSGSIIASSILAGRAIAPVDQAISVWKSFIGARQAHTRLSSLMASAPSVQDTFDLPAPKASLDVEAVAITVPGRDTQIVKGVTFKLAAGQGLGIIGPSGAGKSTLGRALAGAWPASSGDIRLDGASLAQWSRSSLGPSVGYLPQDVQLFDGTLAENVARMAAEPSADAVIEAARAAGIHDMVVRMPDGYKTRVGPGGIALSGGQRQRIGLARALFGNPFLIVLDEPNSNLDGEGEAAVSEAIKSARSRGAIVIVIAHRPSAISALDMILVMKQGEAVAFGLKDELLSPRLHTAAMPRPAPAPARTTTSEGLRTALSMGAS